MQSLSSARAVVRRAAQSAHANSAAVGRTQRRFLASEPEVAWADYRSGKVTLQEWVDGNRWKVAATFFFSYVAGITYYVMKPKKKPADDAKALDTEAPAATETK